MAAVTAFVIIVKLLFSYSLYVFCILHLLFSLINELKRHAKCKSIERRPQSGLMKNAAYI